MPNIEDLVPSPGPSVKPTETDPITVLRELSLAVQLLREVVKGCNRDWELAASDT